MDPLTNLNLSLITSKPIDPRGGAGVPAGQEGLSFSDLFKRALDEVNTDEFNAAQEARNLMTGQGADMHTAILAVQKADVSFQTMMAVRSKLIDAYREVMRMQM
jgi:flagellar hook-basal body complex protein FliE